MRRLFAALAISIACGSMNAQADAIYTRPGTLISAGNHKLNFYCMGAGSPTVVFEGGFGDWSPAFAGLQQRVAEFTRACTYDRAGFGFSEPGPMPRSVEKIAEELHTALHNGGVSGPYLVVGLAYGSGPARAFADRWMTEVAGLVLINGDVESAEMSDFLAKIQPRQLASLHACRDWVAAGKPMPHLNCYDRMFEGLPDPHFSPELNATLERQVGTSVALWDTMISELEQWPKGNVYLTEHRTSFGSRPIRVITGNLFHDTAGTPSADRLQHMRIAYYHALAQASVLDLSSNSKQIFSDTGPIVHFEKPDLVAQSIREAWQQSK